MPTPSLSMHHGTKNDLVMFSPRRHFHRAFWNSSLSAFLLARNTEATDNPQKAILIIIDTCALQKPTEKISVNENRGVDAETQIRKHRHGSGRPPSFCCTCVYLLQERLLSLLSLWQPGKVILFFLCVSESKTRQNWHNSFTPPPEKPADLMTRRKLLILWTQIERLTDKLQRQSKVPFCPFA